MSQSMSKDKTNDRVFQFHGEHCGSCDKTDDTTKTNNGNSIVQLAKLSVSIVNSTREKYKKKNFI